MKIEGCLKVISPFSTSELNDSFQKVTVKSTKPHLDINFKTKERLDIYEKLKDIKYPFSTPLATQSYLKFKKYTAPPDYFLKALKKSIKIKKKEIEIVEDIFNFLRKLNNKGVTAKSFEESRLSTVDEILNKKLNSCGSMASLSAVALRSLGIPTKCVHGVLFAGTRYTFHAWLEIFFPRIGFVPFDVTSYDFKIHPGHIKLITCADWSELDFSEIISGFKRKGFIFKVN